MCLCMYMNGYYMYISNINTLSNGKTKTFGKTVVQYRIKKSNPYLLFIIGTYESNHYHQH